MSSPRLRNVPQRPKHLVPSHTQHESTDKDSEMSSGKSSRDEHCNLVNASASART